MTYNKYKRKYEVIEKMCPICDEKFTTLKGHKKEKVTCSHSCSNTFFAEKRNVPARYKSYRTICFKNWPKKCILCDFDKIVTVHHLDHNHDNNDKTNLIPVCPNHHQMIHTKKWGELTKRQIDEKLRNVG